MGHAGAAHSHGTSDIEVLDKRTRLRSLALYGAIELARTSVPPAGCDQGLPTLYDLIAKIAHSLQDVMPATRPTLPLVNGPS
jgi:hypothetical protein